MRLRLSLLASVTVLALAAAPAARAQVDACPAPVGAACALWAFPAFVPEILAGGESGAALLAGVRGLSRDAVPLVPLAVDPGDGPPTGSLSARLSASQQALLGCGPWWGTPCEASGVNLLGAEASVILQGWFGGEGVYVPGYPGTIGFPPPIGFVPPDRNPAAPPGTVSLPSRPALPPIVEPLPSGWPRTEMAVLSYNFQLLLVAFSGGPNADPARPGHFDRSDPYALYDPKDPATFDARGKCSFLQPQYCASVQAFLELVETRSRVAGNSGFGRRDFVWAVDRCVAPTRRKGATPVRRSAAAMLVRSTLCARR